MSTRAVVNFYDGGPGKSKKYLKAKVYRHSDGYPEGLGKDLKEFLNLVKETVPDNRFNDASYLAAKWVVHDARQMSQDPVTHPLDFLSVGIMMEDPGDIEFIYDVVCTGDEMPKITHRKPR